MGVGALEFQVAYDIAGHSRQAAALVKVDDEDAVRRVVDEIVGNQRTLEGKFRIDRRLARAQALVGADDDVGRRVGTDRRKGAVGDMIARDQHIVGAEEVDAVAMLPGAAGPGADPGDAVAGHHGAVFALGPAVHQDAAIAAIGDLVVRD